eukprot:985213-Rhodomonas_salina.1
MMVKILILIVILQFLNLLVVVLLLVSDFQALFRLPDVHTFTIVTFVPGPENICQPRCNLNLSQFYKNHYAVTGAAGRVGRGRTLTSEGAGPGRRYTVTGGGRSAKGSQ